MSALSGPGAVLCVGEHNVVITTLTTADTTKARKYPGLFSLTELMIDESLGEISTPASLVGRTPLMRLRSFEPRPGIELYAKLEGQNPGGSVKDRAALAMIREGERSGALRRDRILLDATSGNTGISYAMIGAARGYRVMLCVPSNVTAERKQLLRLYGAELVFTDPMDGSDGARQG